MWAIESRAIREMAVDSQQSDRTSVVSGYLKWLGRKRVAVRGGDMDDLTVTYMRLQRFCLRQPRMTSRTAYEVLYHLTEPSLVKRKLSNRLDRARASHA